MIPHQNLNKVLENFSVCCSLFKNNSDTKNAFLAVCLTIDPKCSLGEVNKKAPFGGLIGPGDSYLHNYFKHSKIVRCHAIFHDAYGFMKSTYDLGPGYVYVIPNFRNHFLLVHISGLLYWIGFKCQNSQVFNSLPF